MRGLLALAALLGYAALLGACSRGEENERPKQVVIGRSASPLPSGSSDTQAAATPDEPWPGDPKPVPRGLQPFQTTVTRTVVTDGGPAPVAAANPDDAVLERARITAGGCFSSLPAGAGYGPPERTAHIVFDVIPSGMVSTADVSSDDTSDPGVLDCIHQRALTMRFSDNGGGPLRTYEIDVRVIAKGNAGGR